MSEWFVAGEPAVWLGSGEKPWKFKLAEAVRLDTRDSPVFLELDFRVASFLRGGQVFDLDNMVTPVFEALLGPRHSSLRRALLGWRATRVENQDAGLRLRCTERPPGVFQASTSTVVLDATLRGRLPTDSREGGKSFVSGIQQALGPWTPARTHRFALELGFGDDIRDITWVAEAPIKPVVDCLFPVFGGPPGAPDDWKVHALQVERGRQDLRGACSVKVWAMPEAPGGSVGHVTTSKVVTLARERAATSPSTRRSGMTNFECLDEAAKALGSPPAGLRISEILTRAAALFPTMASVSKDSASATMDFQTINTYADVPTGQVTSAPPIAGIGRPPSSRSSAASGEGYPMRNAPHSRSSGSTANNYSDRSRLTPRSGMPWSDCMARAHSHPADSY